MRIFVGITEIAGYYYNLSLGLRERGFEVGEFYISDHVFQYGPSNDSLPLIFKIYRKVKLIRTNRNLGKVPKIFYYLADVVISYCFLIWTIYKFDVFVFGYGTSILKNNKDLKILKRLNRKVVSVVMHGSESRPPYINGAKRLPDGTFLPAAKLIKMGQLMKTQMEVIEQYSDVVIAAPFTSQFLKKPFINHFCIGLPFKPKTVSPTQNRSETRPGVRVLHSPSKPLAKGTFEIRKAVQSLKNKGYNIDFVEIINQPNSVVIEELQKCDFIIDQLYSDTPLAGFATEAAFYGKPAVVGGYGWDLLKTLLPKAIFPPSEICHPDELEVSIIKLFENREYRENLGQLARDFVYNNWEAGIVADKFAKIFSGQIPSDWIINPVVINYVSGVGISQADARLLVQKVIIHGGVEALSLTERKSLEEAFFDFAGDSFQVSVPQNLN